MEAAGIEPASSSRSTKASYILTRILEFAARVSIREDAREAIFVKLRARPPKNESGPILLTDAIPGSAGRETRMTWPH